MRPEPIFFALTLTIYFLGTPAVHAEPDWRALIGNGVDSIIEALNGISNTDYLAYFSKRRGLILEQKAKLIKLRNCGEYNLEAPPLTVFHKLTTLELQREMMPPLTIEGNLLDVIANLKAYMGKVNTLITSTEQKLNDAFSLLKEASGKCDPSFSPPTLIALVEVDKRLFSAILALDRFKTIVSNYTSAYSELYNTLQARKNKFNDGIKWCHDQSRLELNSVILPRDLQQKMSLPKLEENLLDARDQNIMKGLSGYKAKVLELIKQAEEKLKDGHAQLQKAEDKCNEELIRKKTKRL